MVTTLELGDDTWLRWVTPALLADREDWALELLSPTERARFDATASAPARERLLWGRMLLRELVAELAGVQPSGVGIEARCADCGGPHGRPVVTGPNDRARAMMTSVSACAGAVVVAVSAHRAIGVDVEPRAGGTQRLQAIRHLTGASADPLRHWTRVEAVLKADGRGLRVEPGRVQVHDGQAELEGVRYRLAEPPIDPGLVVSVACGPWAGRGTAAERA